MGCHEDLDPPCEEDTRPLHEVTLEAFEIDRCEVTVAQYDACIEQGECTERPSSEACNLVTLGRTDHPANCVSWEQATAYCSWAGGTLPTEAQWERAARGLGTRVFPWGDDEEQACTRAVMGGDCASEGTEPVGTRPAGASPESVMDMAGNVAEWVSDWYDPDYYDASPETDPLGPETGTQRVIRGGHFTSTLPEIRTLARAADDPTEALPVYGFRCAYSPSGDGGTDTDTGNGTTDSTGNTGTTDPGTTDTGTTDTGTTSTDPTGTTTSSS
jgi:iron(II)-dependent oxidoreductase